MSVAADDRDDSFNYFGDWLLLSTGNPAIHDGTMSQTNQVSAGATFTFTGMHSFIIYACSYSWWF